VEALAGMLYIAVFMARLVTMYSAERETEVVRIPEGSSTERAARDAT
jgi:hypothetical protein